MIRVNIKHFLAILIALFITISNSHAAGFSEGPIYYAHYVKGELTIDCQDENRNTVTTTCDHSYLSPSSWSKFSINENIKASRVRIIYWDSNGRRKTKDANFDAASKESTKKFNLWNRSFFQRPILKSGSNSINYELSHKRKVVGVGSFSVQVYDQPLRYCPADTMIGTESDCSDPITICRRYFKIHNNCN